MNLLRLIVFSEWLLSFAGAVRLVVTFFVFSLTKGVNIVMGRTVVHGDSKMGMSWHLLKCMHTRKTFV
jgi:hypothetical protein